MVHTLWHNPPAPAHRRSRYPPALTVELHDKVIGHYLNIKHYQ
ncbi:hypothetical protein CBL20_25245 [Shigella flexneri]|nr:hypothetical protein CBL20_25245 [Shigella flexneri]